MSQAQRSILRAWRSKPRALRRGLFGLFVGLPALFVAIMLGTNIMIWSGAIEHLASRRYPMATVEIEVGHAWMLWPGKIHVRDFELDVDAYLYQLHVEVPAGDMDIALLDLVSREFHTRSVHGEDVSIWVVIKKSAEQVETSARAPPRSPTSARRSAAPNHPRSRRSRSRGPSTSTASRARSAS